MSEADGKLMDAFSGHVAVKDDEDRVVLQVALIATVYIENAHRREVKETIASCCEDYFRRCGRHLRWSLHPDTRQMEPFGSGMASRPRTWLPAIGENESFSLIYHGAASERGASDFYVEALGMERQPYEDLGFFRVAFPLLWFGENPGSLPEALLDICRKLKPLSGYGGIGVVESPDTSISSDYAPVVYEWAQRFPGLEADYPIGHSIWLSEGRDGRGGIKGVNWLTVVGDRWLAEMGGADGVAAGLSALDSGFVVQRFEGGVLIQAGPHPELGVADLNLWPELYVKLAKYLKPIRITKHRPFQMGGPGERFDLERSRAWLRRFDDR
jgi:hypothetical protein